MDSLGTHIWNTYNGCLTNIRITWNEIKVTFTAIQGNPPPLSFDRPDFFEEEDLETLVDWFIRDKCIPRPSLRCKQRAYQKGKSNGGHHTRRGKTGWNRYNPLNSSHMLDSRKIPIMVGLKSTETRCLRGNPRGFSMTC